nr:MAG TPA: hypothetical protein [Bacteriophage sp.]DAV71212.1 MAG TPA: hypothetical protein [Bacteriophage sp.]
MSFEGASQTYDTPSFFIAIFLPCLIFGSLFSYNSSFASKPHTP